MYYRFLYFNSCACLFSAWNNRLESNFLTFIFSSFHHFKNGPMNQYWIGSETSNRMALWPQQLVDCMVFVWFPVLLFLLFRSWLLVRIVLSPSKVLSWSVMLKVAHLSRATGISLTFTSSIPNFTNPLAYSEACSSVWCVIDCCLCHGPFVWWWCCWRPTTVFSL